MAELHDPRETYDLVISDWTRPLENNDRDSEEGLTLLRVCAMRVSIFPWFSTTVLLTRMSSAAVGGKHLEPAL